MTTVMETCGNCRFVLREEGDGQEIYRCRRYPPTITRDFVALAKDPEAPWLYGGFPFTFADAWCGEWTEHAATNT